MIGSGGKPEEVVVASRESGCRFAREVLSGMELNAMSAALARMMAEARKDMAAAGWSEAETEAGLEAFVDAAVEEWKRLMRLAGSAISGRA